jgi:glycosyltransferase involved in cell wall biosynthesis
MKKPNKSSLLPLAKAVYHRLPLSQAAKWRLRARLQPVLSDLASGQIAGISLKAIAAVLRPGKRGTISGRDHDLEQALAAILQDMAAHAELHGAPRLWIALPFLATGGAEWAALHLCRAALELRPGQSVVLLVTDKDLVSDRMTLPPGVLLVVLDRYLTEPSTYERKQTLLHNLLRAGQPHTFHNINSEVAWHLIVADGEHLKRYTRLYASIFAFQFAQNHRTKIGYAAYFLKKGMPHLAGLLSDNQRFLTDAAREYALSAVETQRMAVVYQPCRLLLDDPAESPVGPLQRRKPKAIPATSSQPERRPQVLWAGRLDAEKRVDLFLELVRRCRFADFRVFGQVVLNDQGALPELPNLSHEGPFTSPLEWLDRYDFDAFVFTSRWEGMPNILLEVGALGIPVIAPTVGGVVELIDETTGYPLPEQPGVADYEQALLQVTSDPAQSLQRASKLQNLIHQRHGWSGFVTGVAALPHYLPPASRTDPAAVTRKEGTSPLVTVIIPCFNQGHYLEQCVMSALSACTDPMEILVVDDGSTDPNIAGQLARAELLAPGVVRIHRQFNQGLSGARNSGIALARGKYLQFLDADDLIAPGKLDAQIAQLEINPELDVSVCNYLLCDEARGMFTKTEEAIARFEIGEQDFLYRWERGFVIPIHAGVFRRAVLTPELRFDTHARAKEDWLFWTHLSLAGARFGYVEGHWAIYRQHETSMRRSYVNMGLAWLQAGLKINDKVGHREPLFFESVLSWFEQCYRSNPSYRAEIARRQAASSEPAEVSGQPEPAEEPALQARQEACAILEALSSLVPLRQPPNISVVVPVYGHFGHLRTCLGSLANQGQAAFEIVCIDDGSPDLRVSLLMDELRDKHPRLIVHREPCNAGISTVQNLAVQMASGEFVAFLDCDDALVPGALEMVCVTLQSMPDVDYLFTDRIDVDETGQTLRVARYGGYDRLKFKSQDLIPDDLLDGMVASHLKVIRRSVYQAVGGCDDKHSGVQDWDLALRIAQDHKLYYLAQPLYQHRIHCRSVTRSNHVAQLRKTNSVLRQYLERWRSMVAETPSVHTFGVADIPVPLDQLKRIWKQGGRCVADLSGDVGVGHINYLREFNAYFDQVVWRDPKVPAALFGYLCDGVQMLTPKQHLKHKMGERAS